MSPELRIGELAYLHLSDEQLRGIGMVIHRAAELDNLLGRLAMHLAVRDGDEARAERYETLYIEIAGSQGVITRLRAEVARLNDREARTLTRVLDECEELFEFRNGIAHGVPRVDRDGEPYMWRKIKPTKATVQKPLERQHEGVVIDSDSLERLGQRLHEAFTEVLKAVYFYWPDFLGDPPQRVGIVTLQVAEDGTLGPYDDAPPPQTSPHRSGRTGA